MESEKNTCVKNILNTLEHIDFLQKDSINRFDQPDVYNRVFSLLETLGDGVKELNHFFKNPSSEENRHLQDLFFHADRMKSDMDRLKLDPQNLGFQQSFKESIDHIHESIKAL